MSFKFSQKHMAIREQIIISLSLVTQHYLSVDVQMDKKTRNFF